jgi:uncharacterized membrane protein YczE
VRSNLGVRIGVSALGFLLLGSAIGGLLDAGLGVDSYDVLTTGVAHSLHISLSVGILICACIFVAIAFALGQRPGWGTLMGAFLVSGTVAVAVPSLPQHLPLGGQIAECAVSALAFSFGISMVISQRFGAGPPELLTLGVTRHKIPIRWARTIVEICCILAGLLFHGSFGVGTFVISFSIGHLLAAFLRLLGFNPEQGLATDSVIAAETI